MGRVPPAKLILWSALTVPAVVILFRAWANPDTLPADLVQPTGEWSARLIIVALMLTPLKQLFPASRVVRWLVRHRRAFGVAAFGYGLLHLVLYVLDMESVANMVAELGAPSIWTAWIAILCLLPPALTSNDFAMRKLRGVWKRLQRFAYPAAAFTLMHWILVHDGMTAALVQFAPLALLQLARIARSFNPTRMERNPA